MFSRRPSVRRWYVCTSGFLTRPLSQRGCVARWPSGWGGRTCDQQVAGSKTGISSGTGTLRSFWVWYYLNFTLSHGANGDEYEVEAGYRGDLIRFWITLASSLRTAGAIGVQSFWDPYVGLFSHLGRPNLAAIHAAEEEDGAGSKYDVPPPNMSNIWWWIKFNNIRGWP